MFIFETYAFSFYECNLDLYLYNVRYYVVSLCSMAISDLFHMLSIISVVLIINKLGNLETASVSGCYNTTSVSCGTKALVLIRKSLQLLSTLLLLDSYWCIWHESQVIMFCHIKYNRRCVTCFLKKCYFNDSEYHNINFNCIDIFVL